MNKRRFTWQGVVVGMLLALAVAAMACTQLGALSAPQALAQAKSDASEAITTTSASPVTISAEVPTSLPRTITVVGSGTVRIEPDIARVTIGVETLGSSVKLASKESSETMEKVLAALKAQGIADKDIQTSGFSIWSDRGYSPEKALNEELVTYRVNNSLNITVRDLEAVGAVLDTAIDAGANAIHGVSFSLDKPKALESEARAGAIADARAKAEELADLTDVHVGQVVSVSEIVGEGGYYRSNFEAMGTPKYGLGGAGPITPGELELSLMLQVVYAIY